METTHHLVLTCPFAQALWNNSRWQLRLQGFSHLTVNEWFMYVLDMYNDLPLPKEDKEEMRHLVIFVFKYTWIYRNKVGRGQQKLDIKRLSFLLN